jgi:hypothetical protein
MAEESENIPEVASLHEAFQKDFMQQLSALPRVADAWERHRGREDSFSLSLTPDEVNNLNARMVWLLYSWIGTLTREVDRLFDELERQAGVGQDDMKGQEDASC